MTLPLLDYKISSQNQRVELDDRANDDTPRIYSMENLPSPSELDELIQAAYLHVFHQQQMLKAYRQVFLESQLCAGQITVREFVRGLVLSDSFRRLNYESNNNYRVVEIYIQRLLGRNVYDETEKYAWSAILMTQGLNRFVDRLLFSEEYFQAFGDHIVPYQRKRILPQQSQGQLPFARMPRYIQLEEIQRLGQQIGESDTGKAVFGVVFAGVIATAIVLALSGAIFTP